MEELEIIRRDLIHFLPQVMIATICGFIVGYDRELKNKVAGIRTNILICVGCALFTSISFHLTKDSYNVDPTRIIGQIITGIGFLGAGAIIKNDDKITGMTTAAFVWVISSIGVMIGCGFVIIPIILTFGLVLISRGFEKFEKYLKEQHSKTTTKGKNNK